MPGTNEVVVAMAELYHEMAGGSRLRCQKNGADTHVGPADQFERAYFLAAGAAPAFGAAPPLASAAAAPSAPSSSFFLPMTSGSAVVVSTATAATSSFTVRTWQMIFSA